MPLPIRKNILAMQPYSPGRPISEVQRELGLTEVIKIASNENPLGPSPKALAAIQSAISQVHIYPDAAAYELRQAIAEFHAVPMSQVAVGNGSDELIRIITTCLCGEPSDEVVCGDPSFVRYISAAQGANAKINLVPLDDELRIDLKEVISRVTANTRVVFLANPNNPTGTIFDKSSFEEFLAQVPADCAVVMDEAYFEFAKDDPSYPDGMDYFRTKDNVVILRTFSKAYGLAGLRVGYAICPDQLADAINRIREAFNVNVLGQAAAVAALSDADHLATYVEHNRKERARLCEWLTRRGCRVYSSYANFVLVDLGIPGKEATENLLQRGIIVRGGHVLGLPKCVRISIGTSEEMDRLLVALDQIVPSGVSK
ncbi:MAG: histidinol-phosphate transaminase [Armatimonadetes bacterium]|nr:histidinol-phosphate transaminase [Armatimonadota bacterium]